MVTRALCPAVVACAFAAAPAGAQPPGPLAQERADLDGDNNPDEIRVTRSATLEIVTTRAKSSSFRFTTVSGAAKGSISIDKKANDTWIVATALDAEGTGEALALRVSRGKAKTVWNGRVGIDDEDTKTAVEVELHGGELWRYYANPGVTRCDGRAARLDAEKWSAKKFSPAPAPIEIDASATTLTASTTAPANAPADAKPHLFRPRAPSSSLGTMSPDLLGNAITLGDGDTRTEWVESRPHAGRGEFITFAADEAHPVRLIRLVAGSGRDDASFKKHNRPRRLGAVFDNGAQFWFNLADAPRGTAQWIALPAPVRSKCVTLVLDSVYPDSNQRRDRGDTALSEVAVLTELDLSGSIEKQYVDRVVAGGADAGKARRKLAAMGEPAVRAITARLAEGKLKRRTALSLRRILAVLEAAPDELAIGLGQSVATERDRDELGAALLSLGAKSVDPLLGLASNNTAALAGRKRAVELIGRLPGLEPTTALVALISVLKGAASERPLRAAAARALGARPTSYEAIVAVVAGAKGNIAADFYRALGYFARRTRDGAKRQQATGVLATALAAANDYETRYRLLAALGAIPDPTAIDVIAKSLGELQNKAAADIALRRVAIDALSSNSNQSVAAVLIKASADTDPGVREKAVAGLAQYVDVVASDQPLAKRLADDPWPAVRRKAAGALSSRCSRAPPRTALRAAALEEKDVRVGFVVLSSTVKCGGAGTADLLVKVAKTSRKPTALRAHAVKLLGQLKGASISKILISMFEQFVADSFSDSASITLAQAAADGMCVSRDPDAVAPLADAAENSAYPEIQAAAARALGCFCSPKTANLLRKLAQSSNVAVSIAATRAVDTCRGKRR